MILGEFLGIVLACRTTRWAADAAGWGSFEDRFLQAIRARDVTPEEADDGPDGNDRENGPRDEAAGYPAPPGEPPRPWMSFLLAFFVIHFFVNVALPDSLTSRWIDWPRADLHQDPGN